MFSSINCKKIGKAYEKSGALANSGLGDYDKKNIDGSKRKIFFQLFITEWKQSMHIMLTVFLI